ncbi:MFS transporter [Rhodoferax aquaticus]|uniref:MFS transporter n=1 Tax=Rhodoferax aquaticus TaxID=2527691 RepID=A0A515ER93_9BURK|nr:MFS transporter [Rhodoferax aquaticus]QDL55192.1 MFS transporter [Rhodoferax aquaticus]
MALTEAQTAQRRNILPFAALTAAYCTHAGFFNPFLPLWLKDLGLSLVSISLLTSIQAATRMFAPYAWGALSDRTGERVKMLRWGAGLALVGSLGLWWNGGMWWLGLVLLFVFTHTSGMMPMTEAAVAHVVSHGGVFDTKLYGRVRLWGSLGFMLAVLGAGAWFEHVGMASFPCMVTLSLVALLICAYQMPDAKETPQDRHDKVQSMRPVLAQASVRWLFGSMFFHVLSHMGIYTFFSLYLDALGYSKTMIGLLWAVSVTVEIAWFFTQSRWLPRFSLSAWLVICATVMAFRMAVTASMASMLWVLVIAQALHALTFAAHHSASIALISHYFPGNLRGRGQALYTVVAYGIPGVIGSLLGGLLSERFGLASVFWATGLTSVLAGACAYQVWRNHHRLVAPTPA